MSDGSSEDIDFDDNEIFEEVCSMLASSVDYVHGETAEQRTKVNAHLPPLPSTQRRRIKKRATHIHDNDARRLYIHKLVDYLNSLDLAGLRMWMESHCTPDLMYSERFVHYVPVYDLYAEYHGIDQVLALFSVLTQAMPDVMSKIRSSHLALRQDGSSYLLAELLVEGTHMRQILMTNPVHELSQFIDRWSPFSYLYNLMAAAKNPPPRVIGRQRRKKSNEEEAGKSESFNEMAQQIAAAVATSQAKNSLSSIPREQIKVASASSSVVVGAAKEMPGIYRVDCTFVMYIDRDHRVYRVEVMKRFVPAELSRDPFDGSANSELLAEEDLAED